MPGLPVQAEPCEQVPQNPFPSQTWFDPHDVPAPTLPGPSTPRTGPVAERSG